MMTIQSHLMTMFICFYPSTSPFVHPRGLFGETRDSISDATLTWLETAEGLPGEKDTLGTLSIFLRQLLHLYSGPPLPVTCYESQRAVLSNVQGII